MRTIVLIILSSLLVPAKAQKYPQERFERNGFFIGSAFGASAVRLNFAKLPAQREWSGSFPNLKIGTMISRRTALLIYLPGSLYTFTNAGRERDRGFEGIVPSVQYWVNDRTWLLGGVGVGLDAPAFYDIKTGDERTFYFGKALLAAVGYEVWRKGKFAVDIQGRVHYGTAAFPEGIRNGMAYSFLVGINWY